MLRVQGASVKIQRGILNSACGSMSLQQALAQVLVCDHGCEMAAMDLVVELQAIDAKLQATITEAGRLRKAQRRGRVGDRRALDKVSLICAIIYCRSGGNLDLARKYVEDPGRAGRSVLWLDVEPRLGTLLSLSPEGVPCLTEVASAAIGSAVRREASRFLVGVDTVQWIESQNVEIGVAPDGQSVLRHISGRPDAASMHRPGKTMPRHKAGRTKFLQRFRKRWELSFGRFESKEHVPPDVLRQKARQKNARPRIS